MYYFFLLKKSKNLISFQIKELTCCKGQCRIKSLILASHSVLKCKKSTIFGKLHCLSLYLERYNNPCRVWIISQKIFRIVQIYFLKYIAIFFHQTCFTIHCARNSQNFTCFKPALCKNLLIILRQNIVHDFFLFYYTYFVQCALAKVRIRSK